MAEDSSGLGYRLEEIQSSIAEGRLMLNVLRSLPTTENNDAFIVRFEDLISRLENYQLHNRKSEVKDVKLQLRTLKEQQDRIQSLLDQTATSIQDSGLSVAPGGSSSDTRANVMFSNSASTLLSKFESLLSNGNNQGCQKDADRVPCSVNCSRNFKPKQEPGDTTQGNDKLSTLNTKLLLKPLDCEESTDLSTQFDVHLSELQKLIEESERFDEMVKRLVLITRRANLGESTKLLGDISKRFSELQISFNSLKESYDSLHSEPQLPPELRKVQLSSFHEFLNSLSRNFDSTKECFYTIHHLVKATIEQQLANGTLQDVDHSDDENNSTLPVNSTGSVTVKDSNIELNTSKQINDEHVEDVDPEFLNQKAYLIALQQRTAQEKEEIAKLLQQRDELAGRLASLKAAASRASFDTRDTSGNLVESTQTDELENGNERNNESVSVSPDILSSLEAKKRELNELKTQLELLRKAEAKIAEFTPVLQGPRDINNSNIATLPQETLDNKRVTSVSQSILPEASSPRTRFEIYKDDSDDLVNTKPAENVSLSSDLSTKADSVTFQQPEVTCIDNTERLYVNMREARIQIEEQRNRYDRITSTGINNTNSSAQKPLQHVSCSGASVATSQDRTTLATWGGSSPVPSCSSEASEASDEGDGVSVSDSLPLSTRLSVCAVNNASNVIRSVPNGHSKSVTSSVATSSLDMPGEPCSVIKRASRKCKDIHRNNLDNVYVSSTGDVPYKLSLPQVGRSPSPPTRHKNKSGDTQIQDGLNKLIDQRLHSQQNSLGEHTNASTNQNTGVLGHIVVASNCNDFDDGRMSDLSGAIANERIQRLETNVAQLYQVCRCLMLENSHLNSAVTQLTLHNSSHQPISSITSLEPSISAVGSIAFHQCQCSSSVPSYNQILLTDSGASYQAMLYRQEHPSKSLPCSLNACPRSSVVYAPNSLRDTDQPLTQSGVHDVPQIQLLINQIMQQQSNLTQLQLELHRLTRSQSQIKPSLLPTDGNFYGPLLSHPENTGLSFPAVTAHLLQGTAGFPPSVESIGRQVNFTGTTNSPQVLGNSLVSPQTVSANWSLNTVPNVHQCSRDATFSNIGQRPSVQTASIPSSVLLTDPSVNLTSPHGSSIGQNNIGFNRHI
uniref:GRIP domain-containing protein n=1 Tax=Schistosoma mansoni TaxID=6183 RepID=A0A3Q0KLK8_SCHMA